MVALFPPELPNPSKTSDPPAPLTLRVAGVPTSTVPGPDAHRGVPKKCWSHDGYEWKQLAGAAANSTAVAAVSLWSPLNQRPHLIRNRKLVSVAHIHVFSLAPC